MEKELVLKIKKAAEKISDRLTFMEVCGTHTMAIARHGIRRVLPDNIKLISGPGCPVCVSPVADIDKALLLSEDDKVTILTFGDMLKVPGSKGKTLALARARGADIRIVYSPLECVQMAAENKERKFVFISVGFETTAPTIAAAIKAANDNNIPNLFILSVNKLIPPAMEALLKSENVAIDGFLCPGHVSTVIGSDAYMAVAEKFGIPCVISGFEPLDILQSILMLINQNVNGPAVETQYKRCVTGEGNIMAMKTMYDVFAVSDSRWRGLGIIHNSGLTLKPLYRHFDAEYFFDLSGSDKATDNKGCSCGDILKGVKTPDQCRLFEKVCTPDHPVGPCMVSSEGSCAAHYLYERKKAAA